MVALLHSFKITHLFGIISLLKRGRELYGLKGHITQIRRTFSHPPTQLLKENYLPQKKLYPLPAVLMTNNEYMANISSIVPGVQKAHSRKTIPLRRRCKSGPSIIKESIYQTARHSKMSFFLQKLCPPNAEKGS